MGKWTSGRGGGRVELIGMGTEQAHSPHTLRGLHLFNTLPLPF